MILPPLLALALAAGLHAAPTAASACAPVPPAAPARDVEAARDGDAPRRADRGGARHALGLGLHSTTFFSEEGSQYTFHSASLGYLGSLGRRGVFVHLFALLPLQARQDGRVYATGDYYRRRLGGDLLLGWQWRWCLRRGVEAEAGPGLHATTLYLPARRGYRDFSALPLGLGAGGVVRWGTGAWRFSRPVTIGTYASAALDYYDPLRADDLAHGFTFRAGLVVGVGARP